MYLSWDKKTITDFSDKNVDVLYDAGYVFTRVGRGVMNQTRSLRVDLSKFELSSENKRILKKTTEISLTTSPIPYEKYDWTIGKMGKDFYEKKFGEKTFSVNKIKELLTDGEKSNFNLLLAYFVIPSRAEGEVEESLNVRTIRDFSTPLSASRRIATVEMTNQNPNLNENDNSGFAICRETNELLHYCYPFYDLEKAPKDMGLGMMTRAIVWAKEKKKKYVYLGSFSRPTDTYKLQFSGVEWYDGKKWLKDVARLKKDYVVTQIKIRTNYKSYETN